MEVHRFGGSVAVRICAVISVLAIGAISCGGDGQEEEESPKRQSLGNCTPLIGEVMTAYQERIDEFARRELDELTRDAFSSQGKENPTQDQREMNKRAKELQCNPTDVLLIVADRGDELIARTPAASVAKAQFLSAAANALFYGPDSSAEYGETTFSPQPVDPENRVSTPDAEEIDFDALTTCADLVEAQLVVQQVTLNEIDAMPFDEAIRGEGSYSLDGAVGVRFQQALDRSECSRRDFAFEYLGRAESLEAQGALANLSKAGFIEEQWNVWSEDSKFSIDVSVTTAETRVTPGASVELLVTIENDGSAPLNKVVLRETEEFGSGDATTVGLPPLTAGPLAPGEKERFAVSFVVPKSASEEITVEYDTAKGTGEGGSAFSTSGTGVILEVRG